MIGIFISYRRVDSAGYAGRLFDVLKHHFGRRKVFMDTDGIRHGTDFPEEIEKALLSSKAMVVIIGRNWLTCVDESGNRRLDNPSDWVRNETAYALKRQILLLPVLVDGATMPFAYQLLEDIAGLANKQATEVRNARWDSDVKEVIKALERAVTPHRRTTVIGVMCATLLVTGAFAVKSFFPPNEVTLEKVAGDGYVIPNGGWKDFAVKALDVQGNVISGAKVAWQTPYCGLNVYVGETNHEGISSATNMCNVLPAATYEQYATPVEKDTPKGFTNVERVKPIGKLVRFEFRTK